LVSPEMKDELFKVEWVCGKLEKTISNY
jgi:hypothetical protein